VKERGRKERRRKGRREGLASSRKGKGKKED
jgi:hypothetical protein